MIKRNKIRIEIKINKIRINTITTNYLILISIPPYFIIFINNILIIIILIIIILIIIIPIQLIILTLINQTNSITNLNITLIIHISMEIYKINNITIDNIKMHKIIETTVYIMIIKEQGL